MSDEESDSRGDDPRGGGLSGESGRGAGAGGANVRTATPFATPFGRAGLRRSIGCSPTGPYGHTPYVPPYPKDYPAGARSSGWVSWRAWLPWRGGKKDYRRSYSWMFYCAILVFLVVFAEIFAFLGPANYWGNNGPTTLQNTRTLTYTDVFYQYRYMAPNNQITFSMPSSSAAVTIVIANESMANLPTKSVTGAKLYQLNITGNSAQPESLYLNSGSTLNCSFTSTNSTDFFISDASNLDAWNSYEPYEFYFENTNITNANIANGTGISFTAQASQDYYLVWNNFHNSSVGTNVTIQYTRTGVYDYSSTILLFSQENVTSLASTPVTVPSGGNWYFCIYFDPWYSNQGTTNVTYSVTYATIPGGPAAPPIAVYPVTIIILAAGVIAWTIITGRARKSPREHAISE